MVIAHTSGALYPAFWFAKKAGTQFAFDVEDYHPWEWIKGGNKSEIKRRETILKEILPHAYYVTAAAPLITKQINQLVPAINAATVYNCFPKKEFVFPENCAFNIRLLHLCFSKKKTNKLTFPIS